MAARWTRLGVLALGAFFSYQLVRYLKLPQFYPVVNPLWIETLLPTYVSTLAAAVAIIGFAGLFWSLSADEDACSSRRTCAVTGEAHPAWLERAPHRPPSDGGLGPHARQRRPPPEPARPPKR